MIQDNEKHKQDRSVEHVVVVEFVVVLKDFLLD